MNLFKWKKSEKPKFPKFIENLFGNKISDMGKEDENVSTIPSVNIGSKSSVYDIEFAVPGLDKNDIKIEVENNILTISSEKHYNKEEKTDYFLRQEFAYSSFSRSFALPNEVNSEEIKAELNKGILKISIPYLENKNKSNSKLIKIN